MQKYNDIPINNHFMYVRRNNERFECIIVSQATSMSIAYAESNCSQPLLHNDIISSQLNDPRASQFIMIYSYSSTVHIGHAENTKIVWLNCMVNSLKFVWFRSCPMTSMNKFIGTTHNERHIILRAASNGSFYLHRNEKI